MSAAYSAACVVNRCVSRVSSKTEDFYAVGTMISAYITFYVVLCVCVAASCHVGGVFMSCDCPGVRDDVYLSFYLVFCTCSKVFNK